MSVDLETQLRSYRRNFDTEVPAVDLAERAHQPAISFSGRPPSRLARGPRPGWVVALGAAVVVLIVIGAAGLFSRAISNEPDVSGLPDNGWIAYADDGIWLVGLDREPFRIVGSDTDTVDEQCPAFSADGRRLAYARLEGRKAALVVVGVDADGRVSEPITVEVGDGLPAPCPVWSPDGSRIAFGAARTSPINPTTSAAGSEVGIVELSNKGITVLPDLLATDLEWSPDGSLLAIASGAYQVVYGNMLPDGRISLYAPVSGTTRSIDATFGATNLTWSPDGRRIAYQRIADGSGGDSSVELRVIDVVTEQQDVLDTFYANHGIGPVWSPDGRWILYQRCERVQGYCIGEAHEVVLAPAGDLRGGADPAREVVIHAIMGKEAGSACYLLPRSVTWSPDGRYLLYSAWGQNRPDPGTPSGNTTCPARTFLAAVPLDQDRAVVKLTDPDRPSARLGLFDERSLYVPIQSWGVRTSN